MLGENDIVPADQAPADLSADNCYYSEATPLLGARPATPSSGNMVEKNIGISQQTLVSHGGSEHDGNASTSSVRASKLPQYLAGVAATLGALAAGLVLGWTSAGGKDGVKLANEYELTVTPEDFSWIGSLMTLGAAAVCVPIGVLSDLMGRKLAMLLLVAPFTVGWLLVIFGSSVLMLDIGRFILGVSGGAFCVTAPTYTAETAESAIRGTLGSYFQLMLTAGILASYVLGPLLTIKMLSVVSALVPLVFFCVFFFMPETPVYHLRKGNVAAARSSLRRLRGPRYDVEPEIQAQQELMAEEERNRVSFAEAISSRAAKRGLLVGFGLMTFQQLSGVNAIIFYAGSIFEGATDSIAPSTATIIVGVIQVVAVFLSTFLVDSLGRRLLLLASETAMFLTTLVLGVYFYLKNAGHEVPGWLPLFCICAFIFLFSIGFGPIPWMMMGEIFSPTIKGVAGSSACLFNWLMAFVVTKYYSPLEKLAGTYTCFWLFSAVCLVGLIFVFVFVPETKGKSLEDIQFELSGRAPERRHTSDKA
ncbi:facilitated trehalose transporter Tret1-2 homolog [Copidosoma floridanum]|uniref:facilitated trehalose transporter Tret1-2 homolog n=1 Tax=Copidosoma floridanum TaxID=29053 RepID=UPI0006C98382|nr:facilitated trehalose transporter Tret1-2 homolog [Copidosoma floridanum]